jgi:outer membrane lipoprotein
LNQALILFFLAGILSACATPPPFDASGVNLSLRAATAVEEAGQTVIWGGTIIDSQNLSDRTRLEVLAYPLRDNFYPELDEEAEGRFIVEKLGYLETQEYAPGRIISIKGRLQQSQSGQIGEASYRYAVVEADEIKLWSENEGRSGFQFHFGIGIFR